MKLNHPLADSQHDDRCIGSLLGCACGDILGANLEFKSTEEIRSEFGRVDSFLHSEWRPFGMYTDDTEMTLALAVSLVECGGLDAAHCASTYARFFATEPRRGYGPAVSKTFQMLVEGRDYRTVGRAIYPEGSYGNGGAMRIAPVGLAFRSVDDSTFREAVRLAILCTHVHPDAVDAAFVQAKAVASLAKLTNSTELDVSRFLSNLAAAAQGKLLKEKLRTVVQAHTEGWSDRALLSNVCSPNEYGLCFQIHAAEAVACAIWAFASCPHDFEECVIRAVALGGDSDTVGALAGALAGALHGTADIPRRWYDNIENGAEAGRDQIVAIARKLARLDLHETSV